MEPHPPVEIDKFPLSWEVEKGFRVLGERVTALVDRGSCRRDTQYLQKNGFPGDAKMGKEEGVTDAVGGVYHQESHSCDMENEVLEHIEVSRRTYTDIDGR